MTLFVDSSGILALIDRDDPAHAGIVEAFALGRTEALLAFMRRDGSERAIAVDADFRTAGFETLP